MAEPRSATLARRLAARERPRLRRFFLACGVAALVVGSLAVSLAPPQAAVLPVWLQTTLIPAAILVLVALNPEGQHVMLALTVGLLWAEALLTAALYSIGASFAIVIPLIGVGIVQPYVRGRATLAVYVGAGVVATIAVTLDALGVQTNPLVEPGLAVVGFGFLTAFALGLVWRAGERWIEALDAADREIIARVRAEHELGETTRLLQTLFSSSPVATMTVDLGGTVSTWNAAAELLFGVSADEVRGRPIALGLRSEREPDDRYDGIARAMDGDVVVGDRVRANRADGSELLVEIHAAVRRDEGGRPLGVVVQLIDVTERGRLEASLRQAQRMEAVGHLAGVVAHDLNNAMTAVGGYASLIETSSIDPGAVAHSRMILAAVQRASNLTSQLVGFAGHSMLEPRRLDVVAFVSESKAALRRMLGAQVTLVARHEIASGIVEVDRDRFAEALRILALRGSEAMTDGGVLTITTSRVPAPAERAAMIVVAVSDTGEAIPPDVAERLFDPFLTTGPDSRTGLELAMVFGIVRQSGGEIEVRSEEGAGSTIEIRLPEVAQPP